MQKIIDYFKDNPIYETVLIFSAVVIIFAVIVIIIAYKCGKKKKKTDENEILKEEFPSLMQEDKETPENIVDSDVLNAEPHNPILNEAAKEPENAGKAKPSNKREKPEIEKAAERKEENEQEKLNNNSENKMHEGKKTEIPVPATDETEKKPFKSITESIKAQTATPEKSETFTADEKDLPVKYAGKWEIVRDDTRYFAYLKASNGEKMLATESYTSLSGIKSGIDTLKKNIEKENYAINLDKNGNFVFKIFSTANRLLCVGEGYSTREQCEKAFASVKRFSKTAKIVVAEQEQN